MMTALLSESYSAGKKKSLYLGTGSNIPLVQEKKLYNDYQYLLTINIFITH